MKICKRCNHEYNTRYKLCDSCRAKNREYEAKRRLLKAGVEVEVEPKETEQRENNARINNCTHREWYDYGEGVSVCKDCGKIKREELVEV